MTAWNREAAASTWAHSTGFASAVCMEASAASTWRPDATTATAGLIRLICFTTSMNLCR